MGKKVLAWVSDHPRYRQVGQSRVTRELLSRLSKDFEIVVIPFNEPRPEDGINDTLPYKVTSGVKRTFDGPDKDGLINHLKSISPDVTVLSHDPFLFYNIEDIKKYTKQLVGYYTIDGEPIPRMWAKAINYCDRIIVPSHYGARVLKERFINTESHVVPYGIDQTFTMDVNNTKEYWKSQIEMATVKSPAFMDISNKFVALYYGHFQGKKNLTASFLAWEKFIRNKSDAVFVAIVHTVPTSFNGWVYEGEYDLADFLEIPNVIAFNGIIADDLIKPLIWASEVLMFASIGEGVGLPNLEAMAGRCLPISTYFAGASDYLTNDNSFPLYNWNPIGGAFGVVRAAASDKEILKHLETAYKMWKEKPPRLKEMQDNAQATAKKFDWNKSAEQFKHILNMPNPSKYSLRKI